MYDCMGLSQHGNVAPICQGQAAGLTSKEQIALSNMKSLFAGLLKKWVPPFLKEFDGLRGVKAGQDPFTPRRATRSVATGGQMKSNASAVEAVLLKTMGFDSDDLAVCEHVLGQLRTIFDSPLQEPQLRSIEAICGKAIPLNMNAELERIDDTVVQ
ncbi:hypothetical protein D1007_54930 [Hordeum vulgare]|nr:hypothetical protein D1007_54930 [Hordeum vulgare]